MSKTAQEKKYDKIILILSIIIPLAVAALFGINLKRLGFDVEPLTFLPPIYASINGLTAVLLVAAVVAIKKGNRKVTREFKQNSNCLFCIVFVNVYRLSYDF